MSGTLFSCTSSKPAVYRRLCITGESLIDLARFTCPNSTSSALFTETVEFNSLVVLISEGRALGVEFRVPPHQPVSIKAQR